MNYHIAPVQGHTDAAWRHYHKALYGGGHECYTPFIRLEKGEFRKHDLKDYLSSLNQGESLVPQVIFRDMEELEPLVAGLVERGAKRIDLNTGCPFPLQTARGRGAAFLGNVEEYAKVPGVIEKYPEVEFSVKMRLGMADPDEWRGIMPVLDDMKLRHITVHPRVAKQQYGGDLHMDQFAAILEESKNPVVFNGDIREPEDIVKIENAYPGLSGIMTGRGILARPSLLAEKESGEEWSRERRLEMMLKFHSRLLAYYRDTLCGDHQILSKIKPFWEYAEQEIGRKAWKAISKASNMAKYQTAVAMVGNQ